MDLTKSQAHCMFKHLSSLINLGEALQKLNNEFLSSLQEKEKREQLLSIMKPISRHLFMAGRNEAQAR